MTNQTKFFACLGGSPAGPMLIRLCTLTLAAILCTGGVAGYAQDQPAAAKAAKPAAEKKPVPKEEKIMGGYQVHSMVELGGRIAEKDGSAAMWATMVNQTTGARVLSQSLEMHTLNPSKTPFFDTLSSSSYGYGGDPNDVSTLKLTKGRWYDFTGMFRRDRNYFDYNLLDNSLLTSYTSTSPVLVPEPDSVHLFNTVRRNTDTLLTLLPVSRVTFRAGFNHGTHEGPTYSSVHAGGDTQVLEWFRQTSDTYTAGVDVKVAPRTSVSYDQLFVMNKGDNTFQLAGANYKLPDGTPVSLGFDVLGGSTMCGSAASKANNIPGTRGPEFSNGVVWPFCSATTAQSQVAPVRTQFPIEQLRLSSHYWNRLYVNGRLLYSSGTSNVNHFNQTFTGWLARTMTRQEVLTGGQANGRLANNTRVNMNGDVSVAAELIKYLSVSDSFSEWNLRMAGNSVLVTQSWVGNAGTYSGGTASATSVLTPLNSITPTTSTCDASSDTPCAAFLDQKYDTNTLLATARVTPEVNITGGWRFVNRRIVDPGDNLNWHQNWLLLGGVIQPSPAVRITANYELMNSKSADATTTPSNTYTREAPDKISHVRARAVVKPARWINFAVGGNDYQASNNDSLVNHTEHNRDISLGAQIIPTEAISFDVNYAHDDVFSVTDLCYVFVATANASVPSGAVNSGTCTNTTLTSPAGEPYLGNGYYDAPANFFSGGVNYAPSKYFRINAGARVNSLNGSAEFLNPLMAPGALQSKTVSPYADLVVNIAPQWSWHGNWNHQAYDESGPAGPAPRNFHGDVLTLGVRYAF